MPAKSKNSPFPELPHVISDWQKLIDVLAEIMQVPAALIMQIEDNPLSVSTRSNNKGNPYRMGESQSWTNSGLYCETVIRSQQKLFVANALQQDEWKNNPDIGLGMINYLGYPLNWPDGKPFGTICVLDRKKHHYTDLQERLMATFKNAIESSLEIFKKNEELELLTDKLNKEAQTDALTGIFNRRAFNSRANEELSRATRHKSTFCILIIDVDHFKNINDHYGHNVGDQVLQKLASSIKKNIRPEDTCARIGGDEFVILLPESTFTLAKKVTGRINKCIESLVIPIGKETISITISIGCAEYRNQDCCIETAIARADKLLYSSKRTKNNRSINNLQ